MRRTDDLSHNGRMRWMLVLALLAACKRPTAPPSPVVVPEPLVVVDASAPDASTPPEPAAADNEIGILKSLCDAVWDEDDKGAKRIGCDAHPPFTKKRAAGEPIPTVKGDQGDICHTDGIYFGAFTRPGAHEVVLSFDSCHDYPGGYEGNYATAVSVVLAEKIDGRWVGKTYDAGRSAPGCKQGHRADGHDVLFCDGGFGSFSTGDAVWLDVFDFAQEQRIGTVTTLYSSTLFCSYMGMENHDFRSGLIDVRVKGIAIEDVNHDGNDDAVYVVERARTMPSSADLVRFKKGCEAQPPVQPTLKANPAAQFRVEVVSTTTSYALSPASKKLVDAWDAQGGGAGGIGGAAPPAIWP